MKSTYTHRFAFALILGVLLAASSARADRPSLVDLQATLDAHVSPPAATAVGTIRFSDPSIDVIFDLVDLELTADVPVSCTTSCNPGLVSYAPVRVTMEQTSELALLVAHSLPSGSVQDVLVTIPSQTNVLRFQNVQIQSVQSDDVAERSVVEFDFAYIQMDWQGASSAWDIQTVTGSGCTIPSGEVHIELAGSAPSNLQSGEIESVHQLGLESGSALPTLSLDRTPPNPCYVRSLGSVLLFNVELRRLWANNDQFPTSRQFVEELILTGTFIDSWTLHIESGVLREEIALHPSGDLRIREFSPVDGSVSAIRTVGF